MRVHVCVLTHPNLFISVSYLNTDTNLFSSDGKFIEFWWCNSQIFHKQATLCFWPTGGSPIGIVFYTMLFYGLIGFANRSIVLQISCVYTHVCQQLLLYLSTARFPLVLCIFIYSCLSAASTISVNYLLPTYLVYVCM